MTKFEVYVGDRLKTFEANRISFDASGTLLLIDDLGHVIAAFSPGAWTDCRKVGKAEPETRTQVLMEGDK